MNREGKRCVLYSRVSTEMQVEGYSLEGQINSMKKFAEREEMQIKDIYEDAGKSGKSIEGRPAFQQLLSDIKNGLRIDYVLVYKLSRFGRNAADILNSLELIQTYDVNLICIEEGIDSSQTSGKLLISVLSAVAEIERENIIEQTMNGRKEKARQGGWNGGPAPYGYRLEGNNLYMVEAEAETIRLIFDRYINTSTGYGGVAKYLNMRGIKKIPRSTGFLEVWSSKMIQSILDNPVYCGKIAYGRRTRQKVKGTKNDYRQVKVDDYILEDGQHEKIIDEETWERACKKRKATGFRWESKTGKNKVHLLTVLLKCPKCGGTMYCNKHMWTNKDGTVKEMYYYYCGHSNYARGSRCDYKANLPTSVIEPLVVEAVKELVRQNDFAQMVKQNIGAQIDTKKVDEELNGYKQKLKQVEQNKNRLAQEIDNLPLYMKNRDIRLDDMTQRLNGMYDNISELDERIKDAELRKHAMEVQAITLENVYAILQSFDALYDKMTEEERKDLMAYLVKEVQIYANDEGKVFILKSIEFNFPVYKDKPEVTKLLCESDADIETLVCLVKKS